MPRRQGGAVAAADRVREIVGGRHAANATRCAARFQAALQRAGAGGGACGSQTAIAPGSRLSHRVRHQRHGDRLRRQRFAGRARRRATIVDSLRCSVPVSTVTPPSRSGRSAAPAWCPPGPQCGERCLLVDLFGAVDEQPRANATRPRSASARGSATSVRTGIGSTSCTVSPLAIAGTATCARRRPGGGFRPPRRTVALLAPTRHAQHQRRRRARCGDHADRHLAPATGSASRSRP